MNNLPIQTYESVVQQRDALAAENSALKASQGEIYDYTQQFTSSDDREMWNAMHDIYKLSSPLETPVTDEFTRELMAKGVDALADHLSGMNISASETSVREFAAQLRKGINDAQ